MYKGDGATHIVLHHGVRVGVQQTLDHRDVLELTRLVQRRIANLQQTLSNSIPKQAVDAIYTVRRIK